MKVKGTRTRWSQLKSEMRIYGIDQPEMATYRERWAVVVEIVDTT